MKTKDTVKEKITPFVLSINKYQTKKQAEEYLTNQLNNGNWTNRIRLYEVKKEFKPVIKFKEVK